MSLFLHEMKGCAPTPLSHYLKALGVLRLLVEQGADSAARGWWEDQRFWLLTKLTREEIDNFFLVDYQPTPLLSPWNKGCGFFKEGDPGLASLKGSTADRFNLFRAGIVESRRLLDDQRAADAVIRAVKARTKTNSTFQTSDQRELLENSLTFHRCISDLRAEAIKATIQAARKDEIEVDIATITGIIAVGSAPTKQEAKQLKESRGYKRLLAAAERKYKGLKDTLRTDCRKNFRGGLASWLAAAIVLDGDGAANSSAMLGTGGNDGNLEFTKHFMLRLGKLFDVGSLQGSAVADTNELLGNALWAIPTNKLKSAKVGQFQPGAAGGANSTTGATGAGQVNPWDFVLMMEGALLFKTSASRRLDPSSFSRAAVPFAVRSHQAGYGSSSGLEKEKAEHGEQWLPVWGKPATLGEVSALFGEARVQLGKQTANRPIDVARAIRRLGVARGVKAFVRYGYLERNGQSTLAVPLGQMDVQETEFGRLIDDIAPWLDRLQRVARGKNAPARMVSAERRLADAVMAALTHDYSSARWQAVLLAAVGIERLQATGCGIEAGPIPTLSPQWLDAADDDRPEFRLAISLGSAAAEYTRDQRRRDPVRHHWLPLEPGAWRLRVTEKRLAQDARVVMKGRDSLADCAAVVERRMVEAAMKGQRRLPLVSAAGCGARLSDLSAVLAGSVDLERVLDLARAFMALRWDGWDARAGTSSGAGGETPPEGWLALRLACLPWALRPDKEIPAEVAIVRRLRSGDSASAVGLALARIRSSGIRPPLQAGVTDERSARLWAAALVFPIDSSTAFRAATILDPRLKGNRK